MAEGRPLQELIDRAIQQERPIVPDTSALLEFFSGAPPFGPMVAEILENTSIPIVHSTITIAEALVRPARSGDSNLLYALATGLERRQNTRIVSFDREQAIATSQIRAATNFKLPDSAVIAAARTCGAIGIVGADRKWRTRELGVPFYYLPDMLAEGKG